MSLDLARFRLTRWLFLGIGITLTGLTWPLLLRTAQAQATHLPSNQKLDVLESLAVAASGHQIEGFLTWLALVTIIAFVIGRPHSGVRSFKLLWGLMEMTLPDAVLVAERSREAAERERDVAEEIVDDFVILMALLTPLADRRDPQLAQRVLDEICKLGARAVTGESSCRVSVWLHESKTGELRIRASHRVGHRTLERFRLRPGQGLVGQVFQTGQSKAIPDVSQVTSAEFVEDPYSSSQPTTIMGLPLYADANLAQVVGVICFSHRGTKDRFLASDLRLGQPYGMLASLVLTILKSLGISLP